jgi:hypothetical protein
MSNVRIAEEIGVGEATVRRARRRSTSSHDEVGRTGRDGRTRRVPTPVANQPARPARPAPPLKTKDDKGRVAGVDITVEPPIWQAFGEGAQRAGLTPTRLINELITNAVDGTDLRVELPRSAQERLDAAMRQHQRRLDAAHAERVAGLDEEVRQKVLARTAERLTMLQEMEATAQESEAYYRRQIEGLRYPFTADQFMTILKCLHPDNSASATTRSEAFRLFNGKKSALTGAT